MNPTLTNTLTQPKSVQDLSQLQQSVPGLLQGLRQSLVSIYQKDNPMIQERNNALAAYLSAGDIARNELLPANQPMVESRPLNFSPTAQNAIVSSRQSAALAPLLGLNQSISQQYGGIGDILANAANIYQAQVDAAQTRAKYDWELQKLQAKNQGFGDLFGGFGNYFNQPPPAEVPPPIESFDYPDEELGSNYLSQPLFEGEQPNFWDTLLGWVGATPRQGQEQQPTALGRSLSGYGPLLTNIPIKLGV